MMAGIAMAVVLAQLAPTSGFTDLPVPDEVSAPAKGSVPGPWAFVALGGFVGNGTFFDLVRFGNAGGNGVVVAGAGLDVHGVPLAVTASWTPRVDVNGSALGGIGRMGAAVVYNNAPVAFTVAAPEVLFERRYTGLRLTPFFAVTAPTTSYKTGPLTTVSGAVQLERRFGPLELSYRVTTSRVFSASARPTTFFSPQWLFANRMFAELWLTPRLSLAVGATITPTWADLGFNVVQLTFTTGTMQINWAFNDLLGVTFDVATEDRAPVLQFPLYSSSSSQGTRFVLQLWFRTDAALQRNWLDH